MTHRQRKSRRRRGNGHRRNGVLLTLSIVAIVLVIAILAAVGYIVAIAATAPSLDELKPIDKGSSSEIFAADGSRLGYVQSDEIRTPISWGQMPNPLRQATVAIEDERFYHNHGVDYSATIRADVKNLEAGGTVKGGSSITQHL